LSNEGCAQHKPKTQEKRVIHPLMSERRNDVIKVITQKSRLKYELKYDI